MGNKPGREGEDGDVTDAPGVPGRRESADTEDGGEVLEYTLDDIEDALDDGASGSKPLTLETKQDDSTAKTTTKTSSDEGTAGSTEHAKVFGESKDAAVVKDADIVEDMAESADTACVTATANTTDTEGSTVTVEGTNTSGAQGTAGSTDTESVESTVANADSVTVKERLKGTYTNVVEEETNAKNQTVCQDVPRCADPAKKDAEKATDVPNLKKKHTVV